MSDTAVHPKTRAVYSLANDYVLEWLIALLESCRLHASNYPVTVIPFDENIEWLRKFSTKYRFEIFPGRAVLSQLDQLGASICTHYAQIHMFRKFAAFWGTFDDFLFLDSDMVLLTDIDELFDAYSSSGCQFMSNDPDFDQVYRAGPVRETMISRYDATPFNAGCFLSSRNTFSLAEIERLATEVQPIKGSFNLVNGDQSFLNYCVHVRRLKHKSFAAVIDDLCLWSWATQGPIVQKENAYRLMAPGNPDFGKKMPYLHWAGFACNPDIPNRKIFLRYRLQHAPLLIRARYFASAVLYATKHRLAWLRRAIEMLNLWGARKALRDS